MAVRPLSFFERMQSGPLNFACEMNSKSGTVKDGFELAEKVCNLVSNVHLHNGHENKSSEKLGKTFGAAGSGLTVFRAALDVVDFTTGGFLFKKRDDGRFSRPERTECGQICKNEQGEVLESADRNAPLVFQHPLNIITNLSFKAARFATATKFLNNKAYTLKQHASSGLGKSVTALWGIASITTVIGAIRASASEEISLREKIDKAVSSCLNMIAWIFDTIAECLPTISPGMAIAGATVGAVASGYNFFSDVFSFGADRYPVLA